MRVNIDLVRFMVMLLNQLLTSVPA